MATTGVPASSPRQIPVKVTTAPTSVCPRASSAASAPTSKSVLCNRMVAGIESTSSPWREERHFLGAGDRRVGPDMRSVDGDANELRAFERLRIFLAAGGEPGHEVCDCRTRRRRIDDFFALADALAHPGEIQKLHAHSSIRCRTPARK